MYFGAGLIPTFMVYRGLGLVDTLFVYVIPYIYVPFRILLLRTYYSGMDIALEESAQIDGANYFTIFFRIFFPLSAPALATIALLTGVYHWNDWFLGTVYVYSADKWPMQTLLLSILHGAEIGNQMMEQGTYRGPVKNIQITVESIKMAMLMITVVPIVAIYPFLQRYFVSGLMIGSLKG
jgi:putative aldouronate transport system permease protein